MIIQICVGSSCHLKGSHELVELLEQKIAQEHLEPDITLAGSFCIGQCNRVGVTVQINDDIITGVTPENFTQFFDQQVRPRLDAERKALV